MWRALELTSIVLYQQEGGADALRFVLMGGDREQDAVYAGFILESTHWLRIPMIAAGDSD
jgi:hypothetical protein